MCANNDLQKTALKVPGQNQVNEFVWLEGEGDGPRVMFVGNSITLHGPSAAIGWHGNWGMAASARERDYVHLLEARILARHPGAAFCIAQGAVWERSLEDCDLEKNFAQARDFAPDVVVFTLAANTPPELFTPERFQKAMGLLLDYLTEKSERPRLLIGTNFWNDEKVAAAREFAQKRGCPVVELGDVLVPEEARAVGLFEHEGVANHPGDEGMARIAERIWVELERLL